MLRKFTTDPQRFGKIISYKPIAESIIFKGIVFVHIIVKYRQSHKYELLIINGKNKLRN